MRRLFIPIVLFQSCLAWAVEPITAPDAPIVVYQTDEVYEDLRENVEMAITGQGMVITNVLHISEMLDRTAGDTGLDEKIYRHAESLEFCSIPLSYQMSLAHPGNMATCPLTISVYQKAGDEQHSYLAYRRPNMLGSAASAENALGKLLRGIVEETLE